MPIGKNVMVVGCLCAQRALMTEGVRIQKLHSMGGEEDEG